MVPALRAALRQIAGCCSLYRRTEFAAGHFLVRRYTWGNRCGSRGSRAGVQLPAELPSPLAPFRLRLLLLPGAASGGCFEASGGCTGSRRHEIDSAAALDDLEDSCLRDPMHGVDNLGITHPAGAEFWDLWLLQVDGFQHRDRLVIEQGVAFRPVEHGVHR